MRNRMTQPGTVMTLTASMTAVVMVRKQVITIKVEGP
jgi:hypothetical protein